MNIYRIIIPLLRYEKSPLDFGHIKGAIRRIKKYILYIEKNAKKSKKLSYYYTILKAKKASFIKKLNLQ